MEALARIMQQVKLKQNMISHASTNYKCLKCKDTTWLINQESNTARRCECYEMDLVTRMWDNFGLNPRDIKSLNEYEVYNEATKKAKEKADQYINDFEMIKGNRENGFCLMGQAGAGKTHIITAIGRELLNKKIPVVYMPYIEVMRELKSCVMDEEYYNKTIERYKRAKVLIIDDLFKDKVRKGELIADLKESDMKHIYTILNYRYLNYLPTLISTECSPIMLLELDEALGGRILECCGKKYGMTFKSDCNYRLKKFME